MLNYNKSFIGIVFLLVLIMACFTVFDVVSANNLDDGQDYGLNNIRNNSLSCVNYDDINSNCVNSNPINSNYIGSNYINSNDDLEKSNENDCFDEYNDFNAFNLNNNPNSKIKSSSILDSSSAEDSNENIYYVNSMGNDSNDGKSEMTSFKTLKKAFDMDYDGSKIIYLSNGTYISLNNTDLTVNSGENLSIIGSLSGDTILDARSLNRFFTVCKNSSLSLSNLVFYNGFDSSKGGTILNYGNLTLINCSFRNNEVSCGDDGNRNLSVYGGVIYSEGLLNVYDSNFTDNKLGSKFQLFSYGGAIYSKGSLFVNGSYFANNALNAYLNLDRTLKNEYNASLRGGAIFGAGNEIRILNSKFINHELFAFYKVHNKNSVFNILSEGGAIFIVGNNMEIDNCSFIENHADAGGSISFFGNDSVIRNSGFSNNSAYTGGAIFSLDFIFNGNTGLDVLPSYVNNHFNVLIDNCNFEENYLYSDVDNAAFRYYRGGGAILLKLDNISIVNSNFNKNGMFETINTSLDNSFSYGGAVYSMGDNSHYENCSFCDNACHLGGAIMDRGINTSIIHSSFQHNAALMGEGGALFHQRGDRLYVNDSSFYLNSASCGGAIYSIARYFVNESYNNHYSTYENTEFLNNTAEYGGGIYDNGDYITYLNLTFKGNSANYGGAVYNQGLANKFDRSTFINNKASDADYSNGGAIYNAGSNTDYLNCSFISNYADNLGGAFYNAGNDVYCVNSSFNNNSAFKGGSIYLRGLNGKIQSNNFNGSFADFGGGIFNENLNLIVSSNNFSSNLANITGACIYNLGENLTLSSNIMLNSSSALSGQGYGDYIYTSAKISYLVLSFLDNSTFNILNHNSTTIFANVTDDMSNPITGGNLTFIISNNLTGESTVIGTSRVIEGIALLIIGEDLDLGTYSLFGAYDYAGETFLTKSANLFVALSSEIHLTIDEDLSKDIPLGSSFKFEIVLIDSNDTYLANVPLSLYKNGVFISSLTTDDFGYLSKEIESSSLGLQEYYLVFNGDLIHDKATCNFSFNVVYNPQIDFRNSTLVSYYPIVIANRNDEVSFEIYFEDKENSTPFAYVSTTRYFLVYRNGELMDYEKGGDYEGNYHGTKSIYYIEKGVNVYEFHSSGNSYLFLSENSSGLFNYDVMFNGGHLIGYEFDSSNGVLTKHDYGYYYPNNLSLILIVKDDNADVSSILDVDGQLNISNVDYASYSINLHDSSNKPISGGEIFAYDSGVLLGSAFTDSEGNANFTFDDYMDLGSHLIEFVYSGDSQYLPVYDAFFVDVYDNPNKENLTFENSSDLNLKGFGNKFTAVLKDKNGLGLKNVSVNVEVLSTNSLGNGSYFSNDFSLKNYTVCTDENGSFSIPLDLGAGQFIINCTYGGNRFYNNLSAIFGLNLSKVSTNLYGTSVYEVFGNDSYLTYVLADEFFNPLKDTRIKILAYSDGFNASYYAFTNESGVAKLKVSLPAGNYYVIASYDGDLWNDASGDVLTNLTIFGSQSYLKVNSTLIIVESGQYRVKLVDDNENPIRGEAVLISVFNKTYTKYTDDSGTASLNINLAKGIYPISSRFVGTIEYKASYASSTLYVVDKNYKFPSVLSASSSFTFRESGNYTVCLTDNFNSPLANQSLIVLINNSKYEIFTDEDGLAVLEISLNKGNYIINTIYKGNEKYENASISSDLVIVSEKAEASVLECPVYSVFKDNNTIFSASLRDKLDNPLTNQKIIFRLNGTEYTRVTDYQGKAYLTFNLPSGSYNVSCKFLGSDEYFASECEGKIVVIRNDSSNATIHNGSSVVSNNSSQDKNDGADVPRTATKLIYHDMITSAVAKVDGRVGKYFEVTLVDAKGKHLANKSIAIGFNGKKYYRTTNATGGAKLQINLMYEGKYTFAIAFLGDDNYTGDFQVAQIRVNKHSPKIKADAKRSKGSAKTITLTATLQSANGNAISGKKISFTLNGKTYVSKTNSKGLASVEVSLNKKGSYSINIKFAGDDFYKSVSKILNLNVVSTKR